MLLQLQAAYPSGGYVGPLGTVQVSSERGAARGARSGCIPAPKMVLLGKVVQWRPWQTKAVGGNAELFAM